MNGHPTGRCASLRFSLLIFDLDGTLVDSRDDLTAAVNHLRPARNLPELPPAVVAGYVGEGARLLVQRALDMADGVALDACLQQFMLYYGAHLLDRTRLYPGIEDMLTALAERGATLAVLSNKPEAMCRAILDGLGLLSRFVAVLGGDSLPTRKPDPAGVAHVCARTGAAAQRVLLVGDSLVDLHTAAAAGIAFCGVTWGFAPAALRAAAPAWLIHHPAELVAAASTEAASTDA